MDKIQSAIQTHSGGMLSSEDSTTERIRLLQEGAEDYIVKPFNPMELKVRIKKIIE